MSFNSQKGSRNGTLVLNSPPTLLCAHDMLPWLIYQVIVEEVRREGGPFPLTTRFREYHQLPCSTCFLSSASPFRPERCDETLRGFTAPSATVTNKALSSATIKNGHWDPNEEKTGNILGDNRRCRTSPLPLVRSLPPAGLRATLTRRFRQPLAKKRRKRKGKGIKGDKVSDDGSTNSEIIAAGSGIQDKLNEEGRGETTPPRTDETNSTLHDLQAGAAIRTPDHLSTSVFTPAEFSVTHPIKMDAAAHEGRTAMQEGHAHANGGNYRKSEKEDAGKSHERNDKAIFSQPDHRPILPTNPNTSGVKARTTPTESLGGLPPVSSQVGSANGLKETGKGGQKGATGRGDGGENKPKVTHRRFKGVGSK